MKDLLLISLIASCACFQEEQDLVSIVNDVKNFFYSGCIFFLHDGGRGLQDSEDLNRISNNFSNKGLSLCIISTSILIEHPEILTCKYNRPVCVLSQSRVNVKYLFQKFADKIQLSSIVWLLFVDSSYTPEEFFAYINIPFDCEFIVVLQRDDHIILTEVYRVSPTYPLQTYLFGNWTAERGLMVSTVGFYKRRNNLQGLVLKTGTVQGDMIKITKEENNKPVEVSGKFGDIWHTLEARLNFSSDYYTPEGNWFGSYLGNGTWNGLVGMIMRNDVHVINVDMTWTADRGNVVDFVTEIYQVRRYIFIGMSDSAGTVWRSLIMPFSPGLWLALALCLLTLSAVLCLTTELSRRCGARPQSDFSFLQSLFCLFSALCSQGQKQTPALTSSRITFLTTHLTAVIVLTSYSAYIVSIMTTRVSELPFNSFEEFLKAGTHQLAVEPHSSQTMYFKMSENAVLRAVYEKCIAPIEPFIPNTTLERVEMICANKKYSAIANENDVFMYLNKLNCTVRKVPKAYIAGVVSFAIQKKSPYRGILKQTLHAMLRTGLIKIDEEKVAKAKTDMSSVSLSQVTPVLVVLASGVFVAIFIGTAERLLLRTAQRSSTRQYHEAVPRGSTMT